MKKFLKYSLDTGLTEDNLTLESKSVKQFNENNKNKTGIFLPSFGLEQIGLNKENHIAISGTIKGNKIADCRCLLKHLKLELKTLFDSNKIVESMVATGDILF